MGHIYYFDHASTTPLDPLVLRKMLPYLRSDYGNPSNLYKIGRRANLAVNQSTQLIATALGCDVNEFIFTGSATESDNIAIQGVAQANQHRGKRIIVSQIEHKGILAVTEMLSKTGYEIIEIPVTANGLLDLQALNMALNKSTILVSITYADSETGTIQPIAKIAEIIRNKYGRENRPVFHTDASQAAAYLDIKVDNLGIDLMTLSAHKLGGPKGIGGLYIRRGTSISPIIYGGGQQGQMRSGTENVPAIVGFGEAIRLNEAHKGQRSAHTEKLRNFLEAGLRKSIPKIKINGHPQNRLPNFLNISILDIEGEAILLHLDRLGIMVNTGSACNSRTLEPSYVLLAQGNPYEFIHGSLRFSLGTTNEISDVKYVLKHLPSIVAQLRAISPLALKLRQKAKISNRKPFIGNQTPHFLRKQKN